MPSVVVCSRTLSFASYISRRLRSGRRRSSSSVRWMMAVLRWTTDRVTVRSHISSVASLQCGGMYLSSGRMRTNSLRMFVDVRMSDGFGSDADRIKRMIFNSPLECSGNASLQFRDIVRITLVDNLQNNSSQTLELFIVARHTVSVLLKDSNSWINARVHSSIHSVSTSIDVPCYSQRCYAKLISIDPLSSWKCLE